MRADFGYHLPLGEVVTRWWKGGGEVVTGDITSLKATTSLPPSYHLGHHLKFNDINDVTTSTTYTPSTAKKQGISSKKGPVGLEGSRGGGGGNRPLGEDRIFPVMSPRAAA